MMEVGLEITFSIRRVTDVTLKLVSIPFAVEARVHGYQ